MALYRTPTREKCDTGTHERTTSSSSGKRASQDDRGGPVIRVGGTRGLINDYIQRALGKGLQWDDRQPSDQVEDVAGIATTSSEH